MKILFFLFLLLFSTQTGNCQDSATIANPKKGWTFGGFPIFSYDTDIGLKYGFLVNLFHYGDGNNYPSYNHSLYGEWNRTTKGGEEWIFIYDNRTFIKKARIKFDISYMTEQALDFYGFNGNNSNYDEQYTNRNSYAYISSLYYRHSRELLKIYGNIEKEIFTKNFRFFLGINYMNIRAGQLDLESLNEGMEGNDLIPDTSTLYDRYVEWGVIPSAEKNGGMHLMLTPGLIFDNRNREALPSKGIWSEILLIFSPKIFGNSSVHSKVSFTHRQYLNIFKEKVVLAYRINLQNTISGNVPFYILPFYFNSGIIRDGMGGAKTIRGIIRNRIVSDGTIFFNTELRTKLFSTNIFNQNLSLTLNLFGDAGMVTQNHTFNTLGIFDSYGKTAQENIKDLYYLNEQPHFSLGSGLYFSINQNFIVSIDYGKALNKQDGKGGFYITVNSMF